ncbi:MAG: hypothetical protein JXK93_05435 [Sphaerochaetaceae bacterium]|nr:hypothetical protein [Sphaerochaetaceae bacterium]
MVIQTRKADIFMGDSDIHSRIRLQGALYPDGLVYDSEEGFLNSPKSKTFSLLEVLNASELDLVARTGSGADLMHVPIVIVYWMYEIAKQGSRRMERSGTIQTESQM